MIPNQLKPLAETLASSYGIDLLELIEHSGGNDPAARLFTGSGQTGARYFVKVRSSLPSGILLSAALNNAGVEAVLAPTFTNDGQPFCRLEGKFVLVYPFKEGHNGFEQPLQTEHWKQIGAALRQIHDSRLPPDVLSLVPVEQFHVDDIPEFQEIRRRLEDGGATTEPEAVMTQSLLHHYDEIEKILSRTEEFARECRHRQWNLVPCHADLHVGNILLEPNGFVNLIDWDGPRLAPRECDLMFFCDGGIMGHEKWEEDSFFEGYGVVSSDLTLLTYYRYARALEDIVAYVKEAADDSCELPRRMEATKGFEVLFVPQSIVESAFTSDTRQSSNRDADVGDAQSLRDRKH